LFSRVFELPLPRNAQKRTKKEKTHVRTFFSELAQMHVVFSFYFFCRPLGLGCVAQPTGSSLLSLSLFPLLFFLSAPFPLLLALA
jgi:hypothetical protein